MPLSAATAYLLVHMHVHNVAAAEGSARQCACSWLRCLGGMQVELLVWEGPRGGSSVAVPMTRGEAGQWTAQVEAGSRCLCL
jgi:hypothetical protein